MHAVFDIITGITESKTLTEHISCDEIIESYD